MRVRLATPATLTLIGGVGLLLSLSHGQEPKPPEPPAVAPPVVIPSRRPLDVAPAVKKAAPDLARMKPLPRQLYLAARRGAGWLYRMHNKKGKFDHGELPALNVRLDGDSALRQAGAAFALARAAAHFDEDDQAARATHAILALLEDTAETTEGGVTFRHPVLPSTVANRVSLSALLVLAINELPAPKDELLNFSDQLCHFLRRNQLADGSLQLSEVVAGGLPPVIDPDRATEYSGQALYALVRSHARRPEAWKVEVVRKALPHYLKAWRERKGREFACWHSAAYAEAYLATKEKAFAEAVLEVNDWVCGLQHDRLDPSQPQWLGGFRNVVDGKPSAGPPDVGSALFAAALVEGCRVARAAGDLARHERYVPALERALQFLTTLQYTEADTQHFADWYRNERLVGGFHATHRDGTLRLDYTQHAMSALVPYLKYVAEAK